MKKQDAKTILRVLLVEDDERLRKFLSEELGENHYEVIEADCLSSGIDLFRKELPDLVISDLRLPDGRGDKLLEWAMELPIPPPIVLITAFGQVDEAVQALQKGAADFLTKPLDVDHLLLRLERIREVKSLREQVNRLTNPVREETEEDYPRIGKSPAWQQIEKQLPQIAKTDDPVLITGPSGSGKEVIARAIHRMSPRAKNPFIPINCAGLPENLLESELFGHTAGAFTGANKARQGLFFAAEGGTLLLDEIGEMPMEMQAKLLRVLQEKKVRSLGADREHPVNVRILASTNLDLEKQIRQNAFRNDLFYRLEIFHLALPSLRERPEDIEMLAAHFLSQTAEELNIPLKGISEQALAVLKNYDFPGNVRELINILRRAAAFTQSDTIQVQDLPNKMRQLPTRDFHPSLLPREWVPLETLRKSYAQLVLDHCDGNKQKAAKILNVSRPTLYNLLSSEKHT